MLKVSRPELGEYWRGGCEQPFCVGNAVECWICKLLVDGDAGAVTQKEGAPTFRADVRPSVDSYSVHVLYEPVFIAWPGTQSLSCKPLTSKRASQRNELVTRTF